VWRFPLVALIAVGFVAAGCAPSDDPTGRVDLVREGFDVAIRGRSGEPDGDLVSRVLVRTDGIAVASAAYLSARGRPTSVEDLSSHDLILGTDAAEQAERRWPLRDGGSFPVEGRLVMNDIFLRLQAALGGHGIALLPVSVFIEHLRRGEIEPVLVETIGFSGAAWIVYPERAFLQPKVRAFVDHIVAWAATIPPLPKRM
jgi:DNA-binding transcriptional LysR family regulator